MNLGSRGPTDLVPRVEDIRALEREIARKSREEEQQAHLGVCDGSTSESASRWSGHWPRS